jgi:hypothetical protein
MGRFPVLVGISVVSLPAGDHGPHLPRMFVGDGNGRLVIASPVIELDHPQLESIQRIRLILVPRRVMAPKCVLPPLPCCRGVIPRLAAN